LNQSSWHCRTRSLSHRDLPAHIQSICKLALPRLRPRCSICPGIGFSHQKSWPASFGVLLLCAIASRASLEARSPMLSDWYSINETSTSAPQSPIAAAILQKSRPSLFQFGCVLSIKWKPRMTKTRPGTGKGFLHSFCRAVHLLAFHMLKSVFHPFGLTQAEAHIITKNTDYPNHCS
jgi:hypothetical protein